MLQDVDMCDIMFDVRLPARLHDIPCYGAVQPNLCSNLYVLHYLCTEVRANWSIALGHSSQQCEAALVRRAACIEMQG